MNAQPISRLKDIFVRPSPYRLSDDRGSRRFVFLIIGVSLALLSACDQSFDPRAPLEEQMVMFSILSTDRDQQFVQLNRNYMPPGYDPHEYTGNGFVSDATVSIIGPGATFVLQDTLFPRQDTSRYKFPMQAYYCGPLVPQHEALYEIVAQSPTLRTATGSTVIPGQATLTIMSTTQGYLRYPNRYSNESIIELIVQSQGRARGYFCRMYVYYDVLKDGQWVEERTEVPVSSISAAYTLDGARYPGLTPRPENGNFSVYFRNGFYRAVVDDVTYSQHPVGGLIYKWVVFTFLQVDQNLYEYYNVAHQYRDPLTVRLDEPVYSTVDGGVGLVGSYSLDSLTYVLPEKFYGNH